MNVPRLHPETIAAVKQQVDILEIVADYVVLRKRGKNHLGLCPFHSEKTPSFTVNPAKQLYHCFGCGAGGNAFSFLMELEKRSFSEVVLELAQRYHIPVKTLEAKEKQELDRQLSTKEQLYSILAVATNFYRHALYQPEGEKALHYLESGRQLDSTTIEKFKLGYAPTGWETLYRYLVDVKRYPVSIVEAAGLLSQRQSGSGYYDRFRDRLMIPICDAQGRVIGFGSRTLTDAEPKYLNSPETLLFDKGKTLFALDQAYRHIMKADQAIVVEGYFDGMALHQAGIKNVVACLGTALTASHLRQMLRYTESKQVILNFDADSAGTQATTRAIAEITSLVYSGQVQLRVLHLQDGKDADEFLHTHPQGVATYRQSVATAPLWLDWRINNLVANQDLQQASQFQRVASEMVKILQKITNFDLQAHYLSYCAELLSQGNHQLIPLYLEKLQVQVKKPQTGQKIPVASISEVDRLTEVESSLLRIYLYQPEYRTLILDSLEDKDLLFLIQSHRQLWLKIAELEQNGVEAEDLIVNLRDYYLQIDHIPLEVNKLLVISEKIRWEDQQRAPQMIQAAIAYLEQINWENYYRNCLTKLQNLDPTTQVEEMTRLYQELPSIKAKLQELTELRWIERSTINGAW